MEADALELEVRQLWRPPPKLSLSEWADRHAVLSSESSAESGRWHTLPYQRGIMDAITDPRVESVTWMKSARTGYTKIINHVVGYYMHQDPCPIMVVQPTLDDAEGYSKDEIAPMLRDTPALQGLVADPKARDSGNTMLLKSFPGGVLQLVGANSPRGFRRVTRRVVIFDEVDGYPQSAGAEGDQISLGIRRTVNFWNRKIIAGSTPTLEITSRIARRFEMSDQRYYRVPCPFCQVPQVLRWAQLNWEKGKPETARYLCEHCGEWIGHHQKSWMIEEADRRQRAGEPGVGWVATQPFKGHAGFHLWAGYSYAPNATWAHLAAEWEACQNNIEELKTFVNTVLGETWKGKGDAPDWQRLYDRREDYPTNSIPAGVRFLFAGADVQKDRIEVEIVGYGRRLQSWSIDYRIFPGDITDLDGTNSPWRQLEALLSESWVHACGVPMQLRMLAVDSQYNTSTVLTWVRRWPSNRVIAIRGQDDLPTAIGAPKAVDITTGGKRKKRGAKQWPVGTNILKTELYGWLKQERPTEESGQDFPYGYCHFPQYGEEFFKGLTAEELVVRIVRGYRRPQWQKIRERNEPLDCRNYARSLAVLCGIDRLDDAAWTRIEADMGIAPAAAADQASEPAAAPAPEPAPAQTVNGVEITRRKSTYWNR